MNQRPPQGTGPREFFEEWLPRTFAEQFAGNRRPPSLEILVRVRLEGEGGGAWDLTLTGGKLSVAPAGTGAPQVTITQGVRDWLAVTVGEAGAIDLTPPAASPLDMLFIDNRARDVLAAVRGTIRFEVTGYNGRTWTLTTQLGADAQARSADGPPDATITVDAETYGKILAREVQPPEAYFAGKIRLSGDTGLAMQLAMAMLPRFTS